ncbi:MAG: hypothetical protein ACD_4C00337G0009 [uncultured bacterium (gcode 4)]|uniref:Uncharacterized protein n=1 Tax=uncultured bacterium (gcode 4) TaxID=1234023 RepID=K2F5F0_9BACT|nr:MAG: hypothetical protein ACD_4C00337G0009 [uncultured bacterium (gcode 4)]
MKSNIKNNKSWFSVIIAMLITAFLIVLSSGILFIVLQETKNSRIVYNTISSYAWAEWALEYALLKAKNHKEGFSDSIKESDNESKLIIAGSGNVRYAKDALINYEMNTSWKKYSWEIWSGAYEIIPLFFDSWTLMQVNSKNPNEGNSLLKKATEFKFSSSWSLIWNIIWNNSDWETFWIVWSWSNINESWIWELKETYYNSDTNAWDFKIENVWIGDFLEDYDTNYLILFNYSANPIKYSIESNDWFSFPQISIIGTARIGDYKQNINFSQNKSEIFELLKYSFFNK